jgi:putative holliday junction resolvase
LKRILGIDVGAKRIGLAQSDPTRTFASPAGTFEERDLLKKLQLDQTSIDHVVIGWPLSMKGHECASTDMVQAFAGRLKKALPGIRIEMLDERFTSVMANQSIRETVVSKKKRQQKGLVDTVAAAILLQSYLDRLNR